MQTKTMDGRVAAAYIASVFLAGFNAIGVRYTLVELPPFWGAFIRFLPAALVLFVIVGLKRLPLPRGRALAGVVVFGLLNFGLSYSFLYWGMQEVQPGMAQVVLALAPLVTLFMAVAHRQERFRWRALAGSLLAAAGIAMVFREQLQLNVPLLSLLAIVMGTFCIAEATVLVKGFPSSHPVTTNAVGMAVGALVFAVMTWAWGETAVLPTRADTWLALMYLILIGSCAVFGLFLYVLKRLSASATSYGLVLMPFVTVAASAWLTGERISAVFALGAALVLAGVYIGALTSRNQQQAVSRGFKTEVRSEGEVD